MLGHISFDLIEKLVRDEAIKREGQQFDYQLGTLDYEDRLDAHSGHYLSSTLKGFWPESQLCVSSPREIAQYLEFACPEGTYLTVDSKVIHRRHVNGLFFWYIHKRYTYTLHCTENKSKSEYRRHLELEKQRIPLPKNLTIANRKMLFMDYNSISTDVFAARVLKRTDKLATILTAAIQQLRKRGEIIVRGSGLSISMCDPPFLTWEGLGMKRPDKRDGFAKALAIAIAKTKPQLKLVLDEVSDDGTYYPAILDVKVVDRKDSEPSLEDW